ncbi:MAG TPA: cytochrome c biogenesis protein CcsA [Blastocatellia bacterium]|jgi:cytochrome c-type biogenesis protein CcsB|nr:cytochrome c biogenesis protein CcsA [Blastocatellia bacterium]
MDLLLLLALLLYLGSAFYAIVVFAARQAGTHRVLLGLLAAGFAAHTASLAVSWAQLGHFPVVNPKEVSSFIAWATVAYYLVVSLRYRTRALPTFIIPLVFTFTLISLIWPEPSGPLPVALEGAITASALTRVIFPVHVTLLIFSYAAFVMTFVTGVMYLMQERELKSKSFGAAFYRLPALNTCDDIGYHSLTVGFVLLTLGMITGIVWSKQRDGTYWHFDPKEVMALVTWFVYLFMIHYRLTAGWRGRRAAWLAIAGFVVVIFTWVGTRYLPGYHVFG